MQPQKFRSVDSAHKASPFEHTLFIRFILISVIKAVEKPISYSAQYIPMAWIEFSLPIKFCCVYIVFFKFSTFFLTDITGMGIEIVDVNNTQVSYQSETLKDLNVLKLRPFSNIS